MQNHLAHSRILLVGLFWWISCAVSVPVFAWDGSADVAQITADRETVIEPILTGPLYPYLDRKETLQNRPVLSSTQPFILKRGSIGWFEKLLEVIDLAAISTSGRGLYQKEDRRFLTEAAMQRHLFGVSTSEYEVRDGWYNVHRRMPRTWPFKWIYRNGYHFLAANWRDADFRAAFQPVYGIEYIDTDDERDNTTIFTTGFRIEGSYAGNWIFMMDFRDHTESGNGPYNSREDVLEDRWAVVGLGGKSETSYDISESLIQYHGRNLALTAGRGRHQWGPSQVGGLFLNGYGPPFDYVRFDGVFESQHHPWAAYYTFLHGFLESIDQADTLYTLPNGRPRTINSQKYLSAQRLELRPTNDFIWGFSQGVIYGDRGLQLGYLTPLNWYYSVQHSTDDKDNVLLATDAKWRVTPGLKLYGELLMDDVLVGDLFRPTGNNKSAYTLGVHGIIPRPFWRKFDARFEYTKVRPFVYSHFFSTNTYSHWTSPLGYTREPNSEFITTELRATFYPVQITLHYSRQNHGANVTDDQGNIVRNVGGDMNCPNFNDNDDTFEFLDGEFVRTTRIGLRASFEVLPDLILHASGMSIDESRRDVRFETRFGFGWNL